MYKDKSFLALIPARGGSKGLPGKNIRLLGEKPLIAWSIDAAKNSKYIDQVIVSTDDDNIANVAKKWGAEVPFQRPPEIATDSAKMMDVIVHAMGYAESHMKKYNYLVLIQPTSPFRDEKNIDEAIELLFAKNAKVILGTTRVEHSPVICGILPDDGNMGDFYGEQFQNLNRQDLRAFYRLNGAIYVAQWDCLLKTRKWFSKDTYAYVMDKRRSIDIDSIEDFLLAEVLVQNLLVEKV